MKQFFISIFEKPKTMVSFEALIQQFNQQGEKTGWTYVEIPAEVAQQINPGVRLGYRIKGKLDNYLLNGSSLLPMGGGIFILLLNAVVRKAIKKRLGETVFVQMEVDNSEVKMSTDLLACLEDAPEAYAYFQTLTKSHKNYFSNWVEDAKTDETKAKRIQQAVTGCEMHMDYGEMIRYFRDLNKKLLG